MLEANKALILLAPRAGFEPATNRLTAGCSTTELPGNSSSICARVAYNKAGQALKALVSPNSRPSGGTAWHRPCPSGALPRSHFLRNAEGEGPQPSTWGAGGL